ncbi:MAG: SsrA-binding protein, partial [Mycoplasmataceae bacterium]|nr:SsrA-binding protein [Mycoplasmataceae bacterium]
MKLLIPNKKLNFNYFVEDKYEAGISLKGAEVKSLAKSNGNIDEAFCLIRKDELFILNMYIPPYAQDSKIDKLDTYRKRKLLMHKHEIKKIEYAMNKQKYTLIPSKVYINDNKIK